MKTEWMNKKARRFLQLSAATLTVLIALTPLKAPAAAAQSAMEPNAQLIGGTSQGPEGSWLYTVTIPGYTFQGIETYSAGGGYTEADQLSFNPLAAPMNGRALRGLERSHLYRKMKALGIHLGE